jgi:hypothetical protein
MRKKTEQSIKKTIKPYGPLKMRGEVKKIQNARDSFKENQNKYGLNRHGQWTS